VKSRLDLALKTLRRTMTTTLSLDDTTETLPFNFASNMKGGPQ
jgi:hypothetical protein